MVELRESGPKLCFQCRPGDQFVGPEHMKPIGEPQINVQSWCIIGQCFDCSFFQRHWVLLELLEEALGQLGSFERKATLSVTFLNVNEKRLVDYRLLHQSRAAAARGDVERQLAAADSLRLITNALTRLASCRNAHFAEPSPHGPAEFDLPAARPQCLCLQVKQDESGMAAERHAEEFEGLGPIFSNHLATARLDH